MNSDPALKAHYPSIPILLRPTVTESVAFGIKSNRNDIRVAADRTIFDVLLSTARRRIDVHNDLLAARIADVRRFVENRRTLAINHLS